MPIKTKELISPVLVIPSPIGEDLSFQPSLLPSLGQRITANFHFFYRDGGGMTQTANRQNLANLNLTALVENARKGSELAFSELDRKTRPMLIRYMEYRGCDYPEAGAEDFAQQALIKALEKLPTLRQPEKLPQWARTIARRLSDSHARKRATRQIILPTVSLDVLRESVERSDETSCDPASNQPSVESQILTSERRAEVRRAVNKLRSARQQELYRLMYEDDLKPDEAANILGIKRNAVHQLNWRLKQAVREKLR